MPPHPPPTTTGAPRETGARRLRWLRTGYPAEAPSRGYSPLAALCPRSGLPTAEIATVVEALATAPGPVGDFQIQRSVPEHADSIPEATDIEAIAEHLRHRR